MRIRTVHSSSMNFRVIILSILKAAVCAVFIATSSLGQLCCFAAAAQTGEAKAQAPGTGAVQPHQTVAPIGNTGYVVPIPEIKMNRIIGDKSAPPSTSKPPKEEPSVVPAPAKKPPAAEKMESHPPAEPPVEAQDRPDVNKLPFEPVKRTPAVEQPREPGPAQEAPALDTSVHEAPEQKAPAQETPAQETPAQETPKEEYRSPLSQPPVVPEDLVDAPVPKKELLGKKAVPTIPPLLDALPVKKLSKATPLEAMKARDDGESQERIPLDPRREAEAIPSLEKETARGIQEQEPKELVPSRDSISPLAAVPSESLPEPEQMEPVPSALTPPAIEEPSVPESAPPGVEQPVPPAKEAPPSPLAMEAVNSPEVWEYLRETAPVLEELSLLMTRAPSLNLADFDPSDAEAPIVPKDIYLKIDAMKRDLQNLGAKTFAIIPPPKYVPFHAVIRESITETYQACDAIISYLNERNDENLQKVMDHLTRARELIRQTRTARG